MYEWVAGLRQFIIDGDQGVRARRCHLLTPAIIQQTGVSKSFAARAAGARPNRWMMENTSAEKRVVVR